MKLIEFKRTSGAFICVNPEFVTTVEPSSDRPNETVITVGPNRQITVAHPYVDVIPALEDSNVSVQH